MALLGANSVSGKVWKRCPKFAHFWVWAVCLTTRLRRVIGCLQPLVLCCGSPSGGFISGKKAFWKSNNAYLWEKFTFVCFSKTTDNPSPWCYAAVRPLGFFFRQKRRSENKIMRIYEKKIHLCGFLRKLIKQEYTMNKSLYYNNIII